MPAAPPRAPSCSTPTATASATGDPAAATRSPRGRTSPPPPCAHAAEQALAAAGLPGSAVGSTSVAMAGGSRIAEDDEVGRDHPRRTRRRRGARLARRRARPARPLLLRHARAERLCARRRHGRGGRPRRRRRGRRDVRRPRLAARRRRLRLLDRPRGGPCRLRGPRRARPRHRADAAPARGGAAAWTPHTAEPLAPGAVQDPALRHLVRQLYAVPPVHLARFAPLAFAAVESADDEVAADIIARAGAGPDPHPGGGPAA